MKRWWMIAGVAVLVLGALALTVSGVVYAKMLWQRGDGPRGPMGDNMPMDRPACDGPMVGGEVLQGVMHDVVLQTFAEKLGLSEEDLQNRLDGGETLWKIASEQGISEEDFTTWMEEARSQALDQAVTDGTITQEQADWMKEHMRGGRGGWGNGDVDGSMRPGRHGRRP